MAQCIFALCFTFISIYFFLPFFLLLGELLGELFSILRTKKWHGTPGCWSFLKIPLPLTSKPWLSVALGWTESLFVSSGTILTNILGSFSKIVPSKLTSLTRRKFYVLIQLLKLLKLNLSLCNLPGRKSSFPPVSPIWTISMSLDTMWPP